ncbi:ABC transporter ATP-binding protein [Anaplasma bovis]|uniref:ABC transporter ATP-binding protein n=1 Tax=Anaplasma bovis TaxID=186733 RepID=UPI002FEF77F9
MEGVRLAGVSYRYRKSNFLLDVKDFSAKKGEVVCLLGLSGCGKSTILKLIAGLERTNTGTIEVNGRKVDDVEKNIHIPTEKRNIGLIFQHPSLFHHQTVEENVAFAVRESSKDAKIKRAREVLESIGMYSHKDAYPHMLSGGQQQLVTIARTIAQKPEIFLLDEPFSNLDVILRERIRTDVLALIKSENITVLFVTHDPEEALDVADKIYVIKEGKIIQSGTPDEIYSSPKDVSLARFFGRLNYFEAVVKDGCVSLDLGKIKADSFEDGSRVAVCIRPDALVQRRSGGAAAVVRLVKFFCNMVYISVDSSYWMKFSGRVLPRVGDVVHVSLDSSKALLFRL